MSEQDRLEVEVKFLVADLTAVRTTLLSQNAILKKARVFEKNVRFDTPNERLREELKLLRLRQDTAVKLTFKGPTPADLTSEAKIREELEIEVSDFDTAASICERLGFAPIQVYEKYRETFQLGEVEIVLDEMPYGSFVELEGPEAAIKTAASQLNLDWDKRLLTNYLALMGEVKAHFNLDFDDLTFANFEGKDISLADILPVT
ncbi:MAG: class IV adenylate cyclase [Chloroflexi bacterium]|nr:MAG: class IV adenylate cyclase [Chloroflexota bacterium]